MSTPQQIIRNDIENQPLMPTNDIHAILIADALPDDEDIVYGTWNGELWQCHTNIWPSCLLSCCFPIILLANLVAKIGDLGDQRAHFFTFRSLAIPQLGTMNDWDPFQSILVLYFLIFVGGTMFFGPNISFFLLQFMTFVITFYLRKYIRERFNIRGEVWQDCVVSYFTCCQPCAIAQMVRTLFSIQKSIDCEASLVIPPRATNTYRPSAPPLPNNYRGE